MRDPPLILVVDDVPDNVEILQMRLEAQGYEVVTAADGIKALEKIAELTPDLVLLDVMMPKLDGIETVKRLKADASLPFIPVILVTAKADASDVVGGLEAGADDYLTKPVDHAALSARVRAMLRIKALHDTVQQQAAELAGWNRALEDRVATQLGELEKIGRLKRFLAPQLAEMIVSSGDEGILESHRRDIVVVFCDLRGYTAIPDILDVDVPGEQTVEVGDHGMASAAETAIAPRSILDRVSRQTNRNAYGTQTEGQHLRRRLTAGIPVSARPHPLHCRRRPLGSAPSARGCQSPQA